MTPAQVPDAVAAALAAAGLGAASRVGVACSGGPDSTALAHATMALGGAGGLAEVVLIHVDHQLRPDSAHDAARVTALAGAGGATAVIAPVTVDGAASLEDAARRARYAALAAIADAQRLDAVLLGHTAADQAETVLMRLLRGTGVAGLAAIPARRGLYLRPLLALPRAAVDAYLATHNLDAADDPMNRDPRFLRTRVRHDLLPRLRAENPRLDDALIRLARDAADRRAIADWAIDVVLARARDADGLDLDRLDALAAPAPLVRLVLARAAECALGEPLAASHRRALAALARGRDGTRALDLPGGRATRSYARLGFAPAAALPPDAAPPAPTPTLDAPAGFALRRWRPGDRMRPQRLRGRSRTLADLFTDARVPRNRRAAAHVLIGPTGEIAWAEHLGAAFDAPFDVALTGGPGEATTIVVTPRRA